jgi:Na+-transporting NADH:ubiquinone oxidoreductase subunit NqrA
MKISNVLYLMRGSSSTGTIFVQAVQANPLAASTTKKYHFVPSSVLLGLKTLAKQLAHPL